MEYVMKKRRYIRTHKLGNIQMRVAHWMLYYLSDANLTCYSSAFQWNCGSSTSREVGSHRGTPESASVTANYDPETTLELARDYEAAQERVFDTFLDAKALQFIFSAAGA
jgi:hypothetical protein